MAGKAKGSQETPILFGSRRNDAFLFDLTKNGPRRAPDDDGQISRVLLDSGIVVLWIDSEGRRCVSMDARHPEYALIKRVVAASQGLKLSYDAPASLPPLPQHKIVPRYALGFRATHVLPILYRLSKAGGSLPKRELKHQLIHVRPISFEVSLRLLTEALLVKKADDAITLAAEIPQDYLLLVLRLAELLAQDDQRLTYIPDDKGKRSIAFGQGALKIPRVFGTDQRLRNLAAVMKYAPIHFRDLVKVTGQDSSKVENATLAPFGRADVVLTWDTDDGPAVIPDPRFPLAQELRALVLKMEETYPLPPLVNRRPPPSVPPIPTEPWNGDRNRIFGGERATQILMTIGVLGWTCEVFCVAAMRHRMRESVKHEVQRFENEGLLQGERARRPGFKVRVLTIPDSFPAKAELLAMARAYAQAFPADKNRLLVEINLLPPRTKAHLAKRGLWPTALMEELRAIGVTPAYPRPKKMRPASRWQK